MTKEYGLQVTLFQPLV